MGGCKNQIWEINWLTNNVPSGQYSQMNHEWGNTTENCTLQYIILAFIDSWNFKNDSKLGKSICMSIFMRTNKGIHRLGIGCFHLYRKVLCMFCTLSDILVVPGKPFPSRFRRVSKQVSSSKSVNFVLLWSKGLIRDVAYFSWSELPHPLDKRNWTHLTVNIIFAIGLLTSHNSWFDRYNWTFVVHSETYRGRNQFWVLLCE